MLTDQSGLGEGAQLHWKMHPDRLNTHHIG